VNASKAGTKLKAPLTAELFRLYDEYEMEGPYSCEINGSPTNCWRIKASGIVNVEPVTDGTITYTPIEGGGEIISTENLDNGKYQAAFKTGNTPAINIIEAEGKAGITVPEVFYDPFTNKAATEDYPEETLPERTILLKSGQEVLFDRDTKQPIITGSQKEIYTVYGVDILIDTPLSAVLIDNMDELGYGHSINDLNVSYTIEPDGYSATTAYVDLIEEDIPVNRIPSEPAGTGSATYAEGYQYNLDKKYEVQVILNPGTGTEIQSDKEELMIAEMRVVNADSDETEELRYSNGTNDKKRYRIELNIGRLFGTISCEDITAEISTRQQDGNYATAPGPEYPGNYVNLVFEESGIISKRCISKNVDINVGDRYSFILTNLSKDAIGSVTDETAPLYGGIGNKFRIKFSGTLNGADRDLPIEPVGVIVIGIDGLRQDVLYPDKMDGNDFENVNDPSGNIYYVDASTLDGLGQILVGDPTDSATQQYIMLPKVTSIFPSITLASWASIFTGKMPVETGILGNEFFARDINFSVPARFNNPTGIISFSSGAFKGFDVFPKPWGLYSDDFFIPYQFNWNSELDPVHSDPNNPIDPVRSAQNDCRILETDTIFEKITGSQCNANNQGMPEVRRYFKENGGDPVVVANSHYARGVYWLTWDTPWPGSSANMMDDASWDKLDDYLNGKYEDFFGRRNDVPFSALTVWYLPGLDHEAHGKGMSVYRDYFVNTTDMYINEVVDKLKELDEFDNKIFIITADHGHTAMPTDMTYKDTDWLGMQVDRPADTSCKLKLEFGDPETPDTSAQMAELENNNLHIWELGNLFTQFPSPIEGIELKVLAPVEIADEVSGATADINEANIISALNGPMAHIYIKGTNWQDNPDPEILKLVIKRLYGVLKDGSNATGTLRKIINDHFSNLSVSIDKILLRRELKGVYEVVTGVTEDASGNPIIDTELLDTLDSTDYINPVERIKGMNHSDRSGDIVLIMKDDMGDINQRFSTGVSCKSWHGGLNKSDSYVPFIVAYPGGNKYELNVITQKVCIDNLCEGNWKAKNLITEIIKKQYSGQ
ncbi:MAG TPA: hypothetical protein ENG83_15915, partial [Nitrospirae bacterium]|nr:hypothetical protein [Nitrospirota bacterium]